MGFEGESTVFETLCRREPLLRHLAVSPAHPSTLADDLERARSTIDRGLSELAAAGLVDCLDERYQTTLAGELALAEFDRLVDRLGDVMAARTLLGSLPADVTIDRRLLNGADIVLADRAAPDQFRDEANRAEDTRDPRTALEAVLEPWTHHYVYVPSLDHQFVSAYTDAISDGLSVELTVPSSAVDRLLTDFRQSAADALATGQLTLFETSTTLPYALIVVDFETDGVGHPFDTEGGTDAVAILAICENDALQGLIANDSPDAVEWATAKLAALRETAQELAVADST